MSNSNERGAAPGNRPAGQPKKPNARPGPAAAPQVVPVPLNNPPPVARAVAANSSSVRPVPVQAAPRPAIPAAAPAQQGARPAPARPPAPRPIPVQPRAAGQVQDKAPPHSDDATERALHYAPPWLVSTIVHMVVLIVLGLLYIVNKPTSTISLDAVYSEELGEQIDDDSLDLFQFEAPDAVEAVFSEDMIAAVDPLADAPDFEISIDATHAASQIEALSIGIALTGREQGMKKALLAAYGGTGKTEAAVLAGLQWLQRNQQRDGSWSLSGPYSDGGYEENKCAATAMALLAFQGAGHTHISGDFQDEVSRGSRALLKMQDREGNFFQGGVRNHSLYSHAQATIAICELYGMTKDSQLREPAQKAIDYACRIQSPQGGWRYSPGQDADMSVTGWFVMALQSAKMAGLDVPTPVLENVTKFLESVALEYGSRYTYQPGGAETRPMTAEALLCRQYLGWSHDDDRLRQGVAYIQDGPINWGSKNVYYWYYATQVLHHMGGKDWTKWNNVMRDVIPDNQVSTGAERGSWSPDGDRWGNYGGRLYETCLCIYMLEVYYRHLPIYKHNL